MVYCNGRIVWTLSRRLDTSLEGTGKVTDTFQLARTNTIKTFLLVGLCFIICWSSNSVYYLMYNLGYKANWNSDFYKFTVVMVFLNCTINPFIYLIKYQDFQNALKKSLGCVRATQTEESESRGSNISSSVTIISQNNLNKK